MNLLNKKIDNYILSLLNVEYIEETKAHNDGTIDIYLNKNKPTQTGHKSDKT